MGYDAGKRIKGRKRHLLVDTLGLVLGVAVSPASTPEREGGQMVLGRVLPGLTWLRCLWVDGGYTGEAFANWVKELRPPPDFARKLRYASTPRGLVTYSPAGIEMAPPLSITMPWAPAPFPSQRCEPQLKEEPGATINVPEPFGKPTPVHSPPPGVNPACRLAPLVTITSPAPP